MRVNEFGIAGWFFHQPILREKTMELVELPAASKAAGVEVVELCSAFFPSQTAKYLNELRLAVADAGVRVRNIAVDMGDISAADEGKRRSDLEAIKQWFHVARAIGSEAIRVNSGGGNADDPNELSRIVAGYRELAAEAAQTGVYILIENHGGASYNPAIIQTLLDEVDSDWFLTCPDTGNFLGGSWEQGMEIMAPKAFSCHVKVAGYSPDGEQSKIEPGEGRAWTCNLKRSLEILQRANYQGPLCIEAGVGPATPESAREAIEYVRGLVAA